MISHIVCIATYVSYDLQVAKGPGFGTNFTLACPYTLLAHYTELEWAAVTLRSILALSFACQFEWHRLFALVCG